MVTKTNRFVYLAETKRYIGYTTATRIYGLIYSEYPGSIYHGNMHALGAIKCTITELVVYASYSQLSTNQINLQ